MNASVACEREKIPSFGSMWCFILIRGLRNRTTSSRRLRKKYATTRQHRTLRSIKIFLLALTLSAIWITKNAAADNPDDEFFTRHRDYLNLLTGGSPDITADTTYEPARGG